MMCDCRVWRIISSILIHFIIPTCVLHCQERKSEYTRQTVHLSEPWSHCFTSSEFRLKSRCVQISPAVKSFSVLNSYSMYIGITIKQMIPISWLNIFGIRSISNIDTIDICWNLPSQNVFHLMWLRLILFIIKSMKITLLCIHLCRWYIHNVI